MLEVKELQTQTNAIVEGIMGLEIDTSATIGQEEQKDVIDWYKKRFDMYAYRNQPLPHTVSTRSECERIHQAVGYALRYGATVW